jgi:hypothetical protein
VRCADYVRAPLQNGVYYMDTKGVTRSISWPKDGCDGLPDYAIGGTLHVVKNSKLVGACSHQPKDAERAVLTVGRETTLSGQLFGQVTFMQGEGTFKAYAQGLPDYGDYGSQPSACFALLPLSMSKRAEEAAQVGPAARDQDEQGEEAARDQDEQADEAARDQDEQADEAAREQDEQGEEAACEQDEQAEEAARQQAEAAREQAARFTQTSSRLMLQGGDADKDDDHRPRQGIKRPRGRAKKDHFWDTRYGKWIKTSETNRGEAAGASADAPMNIG